MLLGTVGAGKITSRDSNELYKSDSSWIDRKANTEKYEDLVIEAFNCLEENQPSTTLSLKAPKKCKISDGSAYGQSKLINAQVLEKLELAPNSFTMHKEDFVASLNSQAELNFTPPGEKVLISSDSSCSMMILGG